MNGSRGLVLWAGRVGLARKLAITLGVFAILSGVATVAMLRGLWPGAASPHLDQLFLLLNLVLLLPLIAVVAWRLVQLWAERRRGLAGSRLHTRLVVLFSLVAVIPTIIVAIFSYLLFAFGVQAWFSERVRTAVTGSLAVAEAYLHEHQQTIRADVVGMANDLNRDANLLSLNPQRFQDVVRAQAALRSLNEAIVFDGQGHLLARTGFSFALELQPVPDWAMAAARAGDVAVMTNDNDDRVRALVRLDRFGDVFLYAGRFIDPEVVNHMNQTKSAVDQYERLEGQRSDYQIAFSVVFFAVGLLLLTGAVWVGLSFATRLARPISSLVAAAERVRGGDLSARVPAGDGDEEFGSLSRAFNRMTHQLQSQQSELIEANRQLDQRRRFTETVLSGVSAGVIGLDQQGRVNLPNRSASLLLGSDLDQSIGKELAEVVPEMAGLVAEAERRPDRLSESQVQLVRAGRARTLLVRIVAERLEGEAKGYVVTFDDITELQAAQRKAAWADVARRIAHEIKNPLTPIQLSAERLKRKYLRDIREDPETFTACTDTIIRHVGDIGRMVDEFSSFARMPAPILKDEDLGEIVRQTAFLQRAATSDIRVDTDLPREAVRLSCDSRQVAQALVNLMKNAAESIHAREGDASPGMIMVKLAEQDGNIVLAVEDNGRGLPQEGRERLTEPYVTTHVKGTGLGLAIVKKIMEDHHGELVLEDREEGGARVKLVFHRIDAKAAGAKPTEKVEA
ncbi:MAG TPA: PAS domain-containing sensor histidine kinase [Stellaceae bacterium]|jgi:two-component system nitrogen regulation sensor histidine kinase NtrY|nr:PAS domain-containing sensor histidine kinase [Stellaceae bacterium]